MTLTRFRLPLPRRDSETVVAIKCLNNYRDAPSDVLEHHHRAEYTFPLAHPHWALSVIHNAWCGASDDSSGVASGELL